MRWISPSCLQLLVLLSAFALSHRAVAANDGGIEVRSYKVWCKVLVTEQGLPKSIEVLRVEPHSAADAQIGDAVRKLAIRSNKPPPNRHSQSDLVAAAAA